MENTSTFGPHVNNALSRVNHRSNRRLALIDKLQAETGSREALEFVKYARINRKDFRKPRKFKAKLTNEDFNPSPVWKTDKQK